MGEKRKRKKKKEKKQNKDRYHWYIIFPNWQKMPKTKEIVLKSMYKVYFFLEPEAGTYTLP